MYNFLVLLPFMSVFTVALAHDAVDMVQNKVLPQQGLNGARGHREELSPGVTKQMSKQTCMELIFPKGRQPPIRQGGVRVEELLDKECMCDLIVKGKDPSACRKSALTHGGPETKAVMLQTLIPHEDPPVPAQKPTASNYVQQKACRATAAKRFVFVFSTGHAGTTTISGADMQGATPYDDGLCKRKEEVKIFHELGGARGLVPKRAQVPDSKSNCSLREWYERPGLDVEREATAVRDWYLPTWNKSFDGTVKTVVVTGHDLLLYYRGIIAAMNPRDVLFVRVRRARYEVADSWSLHYRDEALEPDGNPSLLHEGKLDTGCTFFLYCPFGGSMASVQLRVPSPEVWKKFSAFQRALWYTDETEARWQALERDHGKDVDTVALAWSKDHETSFTSMTQEFASTLGLALPVQMNEMRHHVIKFADFNRTAYMAEKVEEDNAYIKAMQYADDEVDKLLRRPYLPVLLQ